MAQLRHDLGDNEDKEAPDTSARQEAIVPPQVQEII